MGWGKPELFVLRPFARTRLRGVVKKPDAHRENPLLGIPISFGVISDARGVFQSQAVDRVVEEKGSVRMEWQDRPDCDSLAEKFLSPFFQRLQGGASQSHMKGARGNSQSAVNAGVKVTGNPGDTVPLHEGEAGALSCIEEDVIHRTALLDRQRLMDHDTEAKSALIEGTRRPHVMGGKADVIDRQGLGLGNPGGSDLDRLGLRIARRDDGHRLHRNAGSILIADRSGHAWKIPDSIKH